MRKSITTDDFLDVFEPVSQVMLDPHERKRLNIYMMKTNANEFAYDALVDKLLEPTIDFALSRATKNKYKNRPAHLSKQGRAEFRKIASNKGELGEVLLYCFLESHLNAPKILTKYELKTSSNNYANGSDGIHYVKLANGAHQLIFCEAKMYEAIGEAITDAFESIRLFKNEVNVDGEYKPGIIFEKSLLSSHLGKETFSKEDARFLERLIYPSKNAGEEEIVVDDAFAVFIGYQMKITDKDKEKPADIFRQELKEKIAKYTNKKVDAISQAIKDNNLQGHDFYIYVIPFTDLDKSRKKILEGVLS